jgi:hypothetical protein
MADKNSGKSLITGRESLLAKKKREKERERKREAAIKRERKRREKEMDEQYINSLSSGPSPQAANMAGKTLKSR